MATRGSELLVSSFVILPEAELGLPPSYPVPEAIINSTVSVGSTRASATGVTVTATLLFPFNITAVPEVAEKVAAPETV